MSGSPEETASEWEEPSEQNAIRQFSSAQFYMPAQSQIPAQLRDAIAWAESEKVKRGLN